MPLVFAGIVPHSPVLIPTIGKDNLKKIKRTSAAMQELEGELYLAKPDCLIIISPHGKIMPNAFSFNLSTKYFADFKEFGDFETKLEFNSDSAAIQKIRAVTESSNDIPVTLISDSKIDYGISVPLFYLMAHLKELPIVPIYYSGLGNQIHYEFGKILYHEITKSDKRVAIIASGDLSHCLTKKSPGKYSKSAKIFDDKIIKLINLQKDEDIINLDPALIKTAGECGLKSILILLGAVKNLKHKPEILSYEAPFGIGHLVVNIKII